MIPKIIHYCWFGKGPKPELVERCMASWHTCMPDWVYMEWNEESLTRVMKGYESSIIKKGDEWLYYMPQYVREAYEAKKYAFVSDYVRLWALEQYGGLYMDVDFEVYKSFEPLLNCLEGAFVGREGSKHQPPMLGVMASEPHGKWVTAMLHAYDNRTFIKALLSCRRGDRGEATYDMTTNVAYFDAMGVHKPEWVHIYPVDYFCPVLTTGERVDSENTFCEHKGLHSWSTQKKGFAALGDKMKHSILNVASPEMKIKLIKLKRKILG